VSSIREFPFFRCACRDVITARLFSSTLSSISYHLASASIVCAYSAIIKTRLAKQPLTLNLASFQRFIALDEAPFVVLGLFAFFFAAPNSFYIVPSAVFAMCQLLPRFQLPPGGMAGVTPEKLAQAREQLVRGQPAIAQSMAQFEFTAVIMLFVQWALGITSLMEPLFYAKFYLAPRYRKSAELATYVNQLSGIVDGYAGRFQILARVWSAFKSFAARL
jgi:hypothetical protein